MFSFSHKPQWNFDQKCIVFIHYKWQYLYLFPYSVSHIPTENKKTWLQSQFEADVNNSGDIQCIIKKKLKESFYESSLEVHISKSHSSAATCAFKELLESAANVSIIRGMGQLQLITHRDMSQGVQSGSPSAAGGSISKWLEKCWLEGDCLFIYYSFIFFFCRLWVGVLKWVSGSK